MCYQFVKMCLNFLDNEEIAWEQNIGVSVTDDLEVSHSFINAIG